MNTIRILPEKVASQIAAGEVIDRPASVVRELIDNSIDSGADRIVVHIENGGKRSIRVSDNGAGMSRDDLLLCVERHATSKIETASDLFSVKSLGFRGEALPSISSVSRMQITSRPRDQLSGHRLKISGGKLTSMEETGAPPGTVVEARDLFFNIPARRKFLRTPKTETDHVVDTFSRIALPFRQINFKLEDGGKMLMNLPSSDQQLARLSALMGRKVAESITESKSSIHDVEVTVYAAPWELSRTRSDRLFAYVNGRNIRDRLVTRAIMEGYGQRLMKGHYPQAVVFLKIDPETVDVNVHPTKQEVRFHNSTHVFEAIVSTIEKAVSRPLHSLYIEGHDQDKWSVHEFQSPSLVSEPSPQFLQETLPLTAPFEKAEDKKAGIGEFPQIIGQLGNTYILCQIKGGLLIVDQHAAHERVLYENLKKGFDASHIESQTLLVPHRIELTMKETRIVEEKGEQLSGLGLELDHFGGNTYLLRAVPDLLKDVEWDSFISELLAALGEGEMEYEDLLDRVLTVMACHGAIRAGYHMTSEEITHLFGQLEEMDLPTNCPHGRPIFKHFTYYEIEKMFKRVV
jgi:DNA mismatch repair protein MutL